MMKKTAAGAARVVLTTAAVTAAAAKRRRNTARRAVTAPARLVTKDKQRKLVRQTAATRNAAVTDVRVRKPALTGARLTAVKAAAATSARPVTMTIVTTGRRSVFRPMPPAQLITTTAQANVLTGPVTVITTKMATVVNTLTVWPHRSASRPTVIVPAPTAAASAPLGIVIPDTISPETAAKKMFMSSAEKVLWAL